MVYYRAKKILILLVLHTFLLSVALSCIFPFLWMLNVSLESEKQFNADSGLKPAAANWENYRTILVGEQFWRYFINSVFYTFITVFFIVIISSLAAYGFSRLHFPGNTLFFTCF